MTLNIHTGTIFSPSQAIQVEQNIEFQSKNYKTALCTHLDAIPQRSVLKRHPLRDSNHARGGVGRRRWCGRGVCGGRLGRWHTMWTREGARERDVRDGERGRGM